MGGHGLAELSGEAGGGLRIADFGDERLAAADRDCLSGQHLPRRAGQLITLYRIATGQEVNSPRTWQLPNGAINRLLWTPQGFTLVGWSDTQHLDDEPTDENTSF